MKSAFEAGRSILIWTVALPLLALCCLAIVIFPFRGRPLERLVKGSCRLILFASGVRTRLRGEENAAPGRTYVVMMNHVNFFDPLVLYARFPRPFRGLEEESHFRWPFYGWVLRRLGMIPVDRKNPARAGESLRRAAELLRKKPGFSIAILPEGTRTRDGRLGPFKRGGFRLAVENGLDVLPVIQKGAWAVARKGSLLIRPGRVDLVILPPVSAGGAGRDAVEDLHLRVRTGFLGELGDVANIGTSV